MTDHPFARRSLGFSPRRVDHAGHALAAGIAVAALMAASLTVASVAEADTVVRPPQGLAAARPVVVPGNFSGLGFDACSAPDQATMDELRRQSPYWGVGVYIGGEERSCAQPNLTAGWVRSQASKRWHIFPLWVGPQSKCSDAAFVTDISSHNARAARQGVRAANRAVRKAKRLGLARGSTLFVDVEAYDNTTSACNQPVLSYQGGWDKRLRSLGWKAGFYSAGSSGIASIDFIRATQPGAYAMPDAIWISYANGEPTTNGKPWVRDAYWRDQRIHQYRIDVERTFGAAAVTVDENAIEVGRGSVPGPIEGDCGGVTLTFSRYGALARGDHGDQVKAAQCLLKKRGLYKPALGTTYNAATARAVGRFQRKHDLAVTRALRASTWTALLSAGGTPLSKRGSASDRIRAIQRALTAATGKSVEVSGVFTPGTTSAVLSYQRTLGLDRNGVVGRSTWKALQSGTTH
jgi:hypothetical protein